MKRFFGILSLCAACSTPVTVGGYVDAYGKGDGAVQGDITGGETSNSDTSSGDGSASDASGSGSDGNASGDGSLAEVSDSAMGGSDGISKDIPGIQDSGVTDFDSFFDPDPGPTDSGTSDVGTKDVIATGSGGAIFAHSSGTLYRIDQKGFALVGNFTFDTNAGSMTDIAIDKNGALYGVTFNDLFLCDSKTAKCKWLASLPESFNGLTFVPKGTVKVNDETLIGIANSGTWNEIDVSGTSASLKTLGNYGSYSSSGDAFSVETIGTFATVKDTWSFSGTDILVEVNPATGAVIKKIGDTGVSDLWGFAWYAGKFYGFSDDTNVYEIDTVTAKAKIATAFKAPSGVQWWGAGVSTRAALD